MKDIEKREEIIFVKNNVFPHVKSMLEADPNFKYKVSLNNEGPIKSAPIQMVLINPINDTVGNNIVGTTVVIGGKNEKYYVGLRIDTDEKYDNIRIERINRLQKLIDTNRICPDYKIDTYKKISSRNRKGELSGLVIEFDEFDIFKILNSVKYLCDIMDIIL